MFNFLTASLTESGPLTWEMAKQIIQTQSNLAMVAIAALVGIAAFLLIGTWVRNILVRKDELKKAIEPLRLEVFGEMKKDFAHLKKKITDETTKTLKKNKEDISSQLTLLEAEKARLFALVNQQNNWWGGAAVWWAEAIVRAAECKNDFILMKGVNGLSNALKECMKRKIPLPEQRKKEIKQCLSYIPKLLGNKKEEIEDNLNKLSGSKKDE